MVSQIMDCERGCWSASEEEEEDEEVGYEART